jgi:four helix bundle protein
MALRPHEKLEVYRLAHALALRIHRFSLRLPRLESFEEAPQLRRAAKSVAAQVVEGHALRRYKAEYLHYLARAYASAEETLEHLRLLLESGSAKGLEPECEQLVGEYDLLSRKLFNYMQAIREQHDPDRVGTAEA